MRKFINIYVILVIINMLSSCSKKIDDVIINCTQDKLYCKFIIKKEKIKQLKQYNLESDEFHNLTKMALKKAIDYFRQKILNNDVIIEQQSLSILPLEGHKNKFIFHFSFMNRINFKQKEINKKIFVKDQTINDIIILSNLEIIEPTKDK